MGFRVVGSLCGCHRGRIGFMTGSTRVSEAVLRISFVVVVVARREVLVHCQTLNPKPYMVAAARVGEVGVYTRLGDGEETVGGWWSWQ